MKAGAMDEIEAGMRVGAATTARRHVVAASAAMAAVAAWSVLAAMVAGVPTGARGALGPLMNGFGAADLPPSLADALSVLCLPATTAPTDPAALAAAAGMWLAMTVAMMLPPAIPGLAAAGRAAPGYAAGHLLAWSGAALVGVAGQAAASDFGALTPQLAPAAPAFAATVLFAAGLYQFTPAKRLCLERCRRPVVLAPTGRRGGAVRAGVAAALDGLGCCLGLMAAMFAVGLMNLVWLAILTALYAFERLGEGTAVSRAIGAGLVLWGAAVMAASPVGPALLRALAAG